MKKASLVALVLAVVLSACGKPAEVGAPALSAFEARAAQVAAAWRAADLGDAFVPMQGLTIEAGFNTDALKQAAIAGWYTTTVALPTEPGTATVEYADGSTMSVATLSADAAYRAMDMGDAPTGGVMLEITAATPVTVTILTSRGDAEVPAWKFTIKDNNEPIVRVSVSPESVKPLPTPSLAPLPDGANIVSALDLSSRDGSMINYRLGVGACDKNITGLVWETSDIIVLGGSITPTDGTCTAQLVMHPVSVNVMSPVGGRVILDAITGHPVRLARF